MRIIGYGIDLIEIHRIAELLERHDRRFLDRCFTASEQDYAQSQHWPAEHFAGRFAAKEAIFKVLGTGWRNGIVWTDAEIVRETSGRPIVSVHGRCGELAEQMGIDQWWVSISHTRSHATASVIGVRTSS